MNITDIYNEADVDFFGRLFDGTDFEYEVKNGKIRVYNDDINIWVSEADIKENYRNFSSDPTTDYILNVKDIICDMVADEYTVLKDELVNVLDGIESGDEFEDYADCQQKVNGDKLTLTEFAEDYPVAFSLALGDSGIYYYKYIPDNCIDFYQDDGGIEFTIINGDIKFDDCDNIVQCCYRLNEELYRIVEEIVNKKIDKIDNTIEYLDNLDISELIEDFKGAIGE